MNAESMTDARGRKIFGVAIETQLWAATLMFYSKNEDILLS
jgi:hypothetical protein